MKGFILGIAASAIAFVILLQILPSTFINFKGGTTQLIVLALGVGVVNAVIKPVVKILSFPISLLTLGLFGFVVNAVLMLGIAYVARNIANLDFTVGGFPASGITADTIVGAVVASVLLAVISSIVGLVVRD
ncbi:MAG: phage holin family protein [Candidatus Limnocylindrales bacterium]